jgi:hypothetical protein
MARIKQRTIRTAITVFAAAFALTAAAPAAGEPKNPKNWIEVEGAQGPPTCAVVTPSHIQQLPMRACEAVLGVD